MCPEQNAIAQVNPCNPHISLVLLLLFPLPFSSLPFFLVNFPSYTPFFLACFSILAAVFLQTFLFFFS